MKMLKDCSFAALALATACGSVCGQCVVSGGSGPDLIVGEINGVANYGNPIGVYALAFGMTYCNVGTAPANSFAGTNQHMVQSENLFKIKNGPQYLSIEQLGQSWAHHEFFSLSGALCCTDCTASDGSHLGVHCSNPHTASIVGTQNRLGPKSQVNAASGVNVFPSANPTITSTAARRLQVRPADLEPTSSSIHYFVESLSIAADDAEAGNSSNNASRREVVVTGISSDWNFGLTGITTIAEPAIKAWKASDPDVMESVVDIPGDGRFIISSKATDLGGGRWHYEYAVYNMSSDRSCGTFSVPIRSFAGVSNIDFHDVDYHDGDGPGNINFSGTDWVPYATGAAVTWATEDYGTNQSANAIRWGTLYNFRFDADVPPTGGQVELGLFKPGEAPSVMVDAVVPLTYLCAADFNRDGVVDFWDYLDFVNAFAVLSMSADFNHDGIVDFFDYLDFVDAFAAGC